MKTLAIVSALTLAATAHGQTQSCPVTVLKSGYQFHSLAVRNMSCGDANATLDRALKLGYNQQMAGWRCAQRPSGSGGQLTCDATDASGKQITSSWSMPSQRR